MCLVDTKGIINYIGHPSSINMEQEGASWEKKGEWEEEGEDLIIEAEEVEEVNIKIMIYLGGRGF